MTQTARLASALVLIFSCSCASRLTKPKVPAPLGTDSSATLYAITDFTIDYNSYKATFQKGEVDNATRLRDSMINRIRAEIERNYREYESSIFLERANLNLGGDLLELGLALATTISNGERAKTVLGAILTAAKGTRLSFDKNYFREKTIEIIISKMQASRDAVKNRILGKMVKLKADQYTFEESWGDLAEFFYAGTLQGGIQALVNDAASSAAAAQAQTTKQEADRLVETATIPDLEMLTQIRRSYEKLKNSWVSESDSEKKASILSKAKQALEKLGGPVPTTGEEMFETLNSKITETIHNRKALAQLKTAFEEAGIMNN